ncbi:hypothetical protein DICSQDRAFT_179313 [Dichomitus squalens LYAD-421 SS1]|nr:uncharacterized protein DICSQDRAFT_179313 [Dichomitus squalens LYAD-421 SS1]EJF63325.1 hypothetical protein DICSQDRAFT_179313 [Dichomitus squalens LYAD-421 SS1]
MIEEKAPPTYPAYPSQPQAGYHPQGHSAPIPSNPSQQFMAPPPQGPPHQQSFQSGYNSAQGVGPIGPQSGYPPVSTIGLNPGAQYQQQLFAMCAQGNHDVTTKYGIGGIIVSVVCFPCGLFALLCDQEKRCVRCGVRVT